MRAADNGHTATAAELVRLGADVNAKGDVRALTLTLLAQACP
jgi:hypothetical protein